ncbi:hypothetical protein [Marinactinospora rubrisoli]|uniref:Uncharacterized protein n=1 Tax=Marinactinospora rubrisoli TaxID=2715399 RepID=A0ABW2KPF5_9ACTN
MTGNTEEPPPLTPRPARHDRTAEDRAVIRAKGVLTSLIGVLMVAGGFMTLDAVQCGGDGREAEFIEPGETCEAAMFWTREDVVRSYTEQKRLDDLQSYGLFAFGGLLAAAGAAMVVRPDGPRLRRARRPG